VGVQMTPTVTNEAFIRLKRSRDELSPKSV